MYKRGKVYWFSMEGRGYIIEENNSEQSILFHYSVVKKKSKNEFIDIPEGQLVKFKCVVLEGRLVASEVIRI